MAETRLEASCAKCCSKLINTSSSCCKMHERWQLGGSISAVRIKTEAVEMWCISLLQEWEAACSRLRQNLWEGLMLNNWRLLLHSPMSVLPVSSSPSREQAAEKRDFVPLLNRYLLARCWGLSRFCWSTVEGSMVVSSELAYVVVPKRRKQLT